jgi:pyruvate kinase
MLAMARAGVDVARVNFSHADHETHEKSVALVREINQQYGFNIPILQDLQGPKMRLGNLKEPLKVKEGSIITLRTDIVDQEDKNSEIPIVFETLAQDVNVGDPILMDDGKILATVVETNRVNLVKLRIDAGDLIQSRKGVNLPRTRISLPTITEKDYRDIDFAVKHNIEWVALSFVRSADDIRLLKELIRLKNGNSRVIAKIEKPEALANIDEIIKVTDAVMVARGDLGVEIPLEEVPVWQKRIIRKANAAAKPVIVATQVMESMITNQRPTRAEAGDVANALIDGADAVMLSGETSVGKYPVDVIENMDKILKSVEKEDMSIYYKNLNTIPEGTELLSGAMINTSCKLAQETDAKAIIGMTRSGYTVMNLARCRPKAFIYAFSDNPSVLSTLNLVWGIRAFFYDKFVSTDDTIQDVHEILKHYELLQPGDVMINTGSMPLHEMGLTNMVKVSRVKPKVV